MAGSVEPLVVEDATSDSFFAVLPGTAALGIRGYVGVPVVRGDGSLFGTLCGIDPAPHRRSETELAALAVLARLVAFQIDALELAHLEGVRLAARTVEHEVKNALVPAVFHASVLSRATELPPHLRSAAAAALASARKAAELVDRLVGLDEIVEVDWGSSTTIDLRGRPEA